MTSGCPAIRWAGWAASAATIAWMTVSPVSAAAGLSAAGTMTSGLMALAARFGSKAGAVASTTIVRAAMSCHALRRASTNTHSQPM